jgi:purine-binding chemotaxis protein CheW
MAPIDFLNVPERLLIFSVGDEYYGVDIAAVHEITPCESVTPVPEAPPGLLGIATFRGTQVPVFDLFWKFGVEVGPSTDANLVVVDYDGSPVALRAGEVHEVAALPRDAYQPLSIPGGTGRLTQFEAVAEWHDQLVLWLDPRRLVPAAVAEAA